MPSSAPSACINRRASVLLIVALLGSLPALAQDPSTSLAGVVDDIYDAFRGTDRPGCVVSVAYRGELLERAYGMANLEYGVANTPETIMEPGSVSKQFTAAATILLALDGALSLDDDIRKFFPELPDYGQVITIRHLVNHTSGLRDWGAIAAFGGWPRTTRVHTHTHMLDIASRQTALNYPPGEYYSYTNTGYNLQAVLVERVTGMSFSEFSRTRIFEPLGMNHTSWRDVFTRVVPNRATAYRPDGDGGYRMLMPFENVYGNGGLLTTAGDLLLFSANLETGAALGGAAFVEEMHRQGVLNSGREISYASGLIVGDFKGVPEVAHTGATAAYRGFSARYPGHDLAVASMCNASNASPGQMGRQIVEHLLAESLKEPNPTPEPLVRIPPDRLADLAGSFVSSRRMTLQTVQATDDGLRYSGTEYAPTSGTRFVGADGQILEFLESDRLIAVSADRDSLRLDRAESFNPSPEELAEYAGAYESTEAEVTYTISVEERALVIRNRYDSYARVRPIYPDAFQSPFGTLLFRRDDRGQVEAMSLLDSRVWDLRFSRLP